MAGIENALPLATAPTSVKMAVNLGGLKMKNPVTVASVMHKGSYADVPQAYAFVMDWVESNGCRVTESPRESYIDGIWNQADEADWLTEIQVPIEQA